MYILEPKDFLLIKKTINFKKIKFISLPTLFWLRRYE